MFKAAVLQNNFIPGGTTQVTLAVIEVLNDLGAVPDVYCFEGIEADKLNQNGARSLSYHLEIIPDLGSKSFGALKGILRNLYFKQRSEEYSLVFNADSYLMFLLDERKYFHYILCPRRVEIKHFSPKVSPLEKYLYRVPISMLYKFEKVQESSSYFVLSEFSRSLLESHYHIPEEANIHILYPPVNLDAFWSSSNGRSKIVSTVGSFDPSKNQLGQIELASRMPDFKFLIMGTTHLNPSYFRRCQEKVVQLGLTNVELLPDIARGKLIGFLQQSMFFLHTKEYEPFGIAAVEAAAAGCVPIVHQSGGQIETIPYQELQFENLQEVPEMVRGLNADGCVEILSGLRKHIKKFDKGRFKERFREHIQNIFNGST